MIRSPLRTRALQVTSACTLFLLAAQMHAQTIRPGGNTRTGTRNNATTTTTRTATSGVGGGAGGPRQYRSNTMLGEAMIQTDPETRSLVVVTDEETHEELSKVIRDLDRPKPQVLIKVVFVEVTHNKGSDIGVEGSYTFRLDNAIPATTGNQTTTSTQTTTGLPVTNPDGTTTTTGNTTTTSTLTTPLGTAASLASTANLQSLFGLAAETSGTFARIVTDDWSATLRLLATQGKVEVLSRPSIMARNNQEAVIVVGQEVPFVTNSRITDDGQTINTIEYDNVGIILRVTPFITSDNAVEMIVAPEISNLTDRTVPISNTASAPVIAKRSAETVVVTPNKTTVVIGGLMETQRIESVRKIPILGDIPILGFPFRRTIKDHVKKELMIFLTPEIVNSPASVEKVTTTEMARTELVERSFRPDELDKYFEPERAEQMIVEGKAVVLPDKPTVRRAVAVEHSGPVKVEAKSRTTESVTVTPVKSERIRR